MTWEGCSKIWQLEKLSDGWVVFANNKDWQGQSIFKQVTADLSEKSLSMAFH